MNATRPISRKPFRFILSGKQKETSLLLRWRARAAWLWLAPPQTAERQNCMTYSVCLQSGPFRVAGAARPTAALLPRNTKQAHYFSIDVSRSPTRPLCRRQQRQHWGAGCTAMTNSLLQAAAGRGAAQRRRSGPSQCHAGCASRLRRHHKTCVCSPKGLTPCVYGGTTIMHQSVSLTTAGLCILQKQFSNVVQLRLQFFKSRTVIVPLCLRVVPLRGRCGALPSRRLHYTHDAENAGPSSRCANHRPLLWPSSSVSSRGPLHPAGLATCVRSFPGGGGGMGQTPGGEGAVRVSGAPSIEQAGATFQFRARREIDEKFVST